MTRARENITQQIIVGLKQQVEAAQSDPQTLKHLLIGELKLQQEAEWDYAREDIAKAVAFLKSNVESYTSSGQFAFVKKWGIPFEMIAQLGLSREDFPPHWHAFVNDFMVEKLSCHGGRIVKELEYKLGISEPPEEDASLRVDESSVQRAERLAKANHKRKIQVKETLDGFEAESMFWSTENLCRVFIAYLATFSNDTEITSEIVHIRKDVISGLISKEVLPCIDDLSVKYEKYVEALQLVRAHHNSADGLREHDEVYVKVQAIYDDFALARAHDDKLAKLNEWQCVNQLVAKHPANNESYAEYVNIIQSLHLLCLESEKRQAEPDIQPASSLVKSPYILAGIGAGLFTGIAIVLGLVFGGALAFITAPVAAAIILSVIVATAIVGGAIGFGVSKYSDTSGSANISTATPAETPSSSVISSFRETCSTGICALFLGLTSCCFVTDVIAQVAPTEQQSSQDDQDDATDEVELSSTSGKRFG